MIDVQEKKRKIMSFLENNGPSLPVRIAREIQMDPVFASAILSELLGPKQLKLSHMKIGSSPLYLLPNQEQRLEELSDNLKSVEKEAYLKLKEIKLIIDEDESPAIRVALRNIKDFAIPFKFQEKIMWKYAFTPEEEVQKLLSGPQKEDEEVEEEDVEKEEAPEQEEEVPKAWEVKKEEIKQAKEESRKIESIFTEEEEPDVKSNKPKKFLEEVEEFLESNGSKIIAPIEVDKKKVVAETESGNGKAMLFAFNKKKITEDELMKCYKQAKDSNLPYHVIILSEPTKKLSDTIDAYKKLLRVEKLDTN